MTKRGDLTRRDYLAATGAGALAATLGVRPAAAVETVRQGYQTNMWGMPTYYLLRSGLLEKHGIKFEEFAVPPGNLTMPQMVARQVDMGTYAGPSFAIGHDKGGLLAIAMIEYVGKTARVMARKDLNITKVEQLKGLKVANQTGSSTGNIFVDQIAPKAGLKKGDYQEVRMNVDDMVAAMAAKTVDAMANVEPYNAIAEADGLAITLSEYSQFDKLPVFMAATPEFVQKSPETIVAYLKAWLEVAKDFKSQPDKVADTVYSFFESKGFKMSKDTFAKALARVEVQPGWPSDLVPYMQEQSEILLKENKIKAVPDWNKALRTKFLNQANEKHPQLQHSAHCSNRGRRKLRRPFRITKPRRRECPTPPARSTKARSPPHGISNCSRKTISAASAAWAKACRSRSQKMDDASFGSRMKARRRISPRSMFPIHATRKLWRRPTCPNRICDPIRWNCPATSWRSLTRLRK